jgi:hypothetical protein
MEFVNFGELLLKLSENILVENEEVYDKLELFYSENDRHEYSQISQLVFNQEDEKNELMDLNLDDIIETAKNRGSLYIKNYKKLKDHLNLCVVQKKFFEVHLNSIKNEHNMARSEIEASISQATATISNIEEMSSQQSNKLSEIELHSKKITTDFVSILGIFSSVIFAAFGGLEILKNILGGIEKVPTEKLLVFSSLTIGAIVFLVFLLLNGIAKLTNLNLRSCRCPTNTTCNCNLVQKHPSIVIIYLVLSFIFLIGVTGYVLDYGQLINDLIKNWMSWLKITIVFLSSVLFFIVSIIWFTKMKKANT